MGDHLNLAFALSCHTFDTAVYLVLRRTSTRDVGVFANSKYLTALLTYAQMILASLSADTMCLEVTMCEIARWACAKPVAGEIPEICSSRYDNEYTFIRYNFDVAGQKSSPSDVLDEMIYPKELCDGAVLACVLSPEFVFR